MSDYILIDGDDVIFELNFGKALVFVKKAQLKGSGDENIDGKKVCLEGDEKNVSAPGCSYIASPYIIPGNGTISIASLGSNQIAKKKKNKGKYVLLKGSKFDAKFKVSSQAKQPNPSGSPVPDPTPEYKGKGSFMNKNNKYKAT